ncbi:class I SAM-dependent methyltransferase [Aeoliella sp.]|uniref:class I SAM-dependent methyltransferase n=1 Tax=Aeoliella sp. TaxID=2795800 RepID=UPI003CCC466C
MQAPTVSSDETLDSPFDRLRSQYNFMNFRNYAHVLTDVVVGELERRGGGRTLDVGCGKGIGRDTQHQWKVKEASTEFWGVEPDESIEPEAGLFDNFQHALLETAELPDHSIDVAYSSMVMEHVEHPVEFFQTLERCLKPDGIYIFLTPNAKSFIPLMTKWANQMGIDEWLLRLIRRKNQVEEYHYPVQFRCNSPAQIRDIAGKCGFGEPEFAYIEGSGAYSYLRGPLACLRPVLKAKRRTWKRPERLATMICRMQAAG